MCETDVLILLYIPVYSHFSEDGDLLLKHVGGLKFVCNICLYCVHLLVYINE